MKMRKQGSEKVIQQKDTRARKREIKRISEGKTKHLKYENDDERKIGRIKRI